jgi:hypothetical protein
MEFISKHFTLKTLSFVFLSFTCIASQMDLEGTTNLNTPVEDGIQEIVDSPCEWDANQMSDSFTLVNLAARSSKDIGFMHLAARSSKDIGACA